MKKFNFIFLMFIFISATTFAQRSSMEYYDMGIDLYNQEKYEMAIRNFSLALKLPSTDDELYKMYVARGNTRMKMKEWNGAKADYTEAIKLGADSAEAYYLRANAKVKLKDFASAIKDYTLAIEKRPNYADAYFARGNAKTKIKTDKDPCFDWEKAKQFGNIEAEEMIEKNCKD